MQIKTYIGDELCIIKLLSWEYYTPAKLSGPPEDCYPDDGGYGEWEVCDLNGNRNDALAEKMSDEDIDDINEQFFKLMERDDEY